MKSSFAVQPGSLVLGLVFLSCSPAPAPYQEPAAAKVAEAAADAQRQVKIRGRVHGYYGQSLPLAQVFLHSEALERSVILRTEEDGSFEFDAPAGLVQLAATGVDHRLSVQSMVLGDADVDISIRLATHDIKPDFEGASVIASVDGGEPRVFPATRVADGKLYVEADLPPGTIRYQFAQVVGGGHVVNGGRADRYEYDGGAAYWSVIRSAGGVISFVFDPRLLPPPGQASEFEFANRYSVAARAAALLQRCFAAQEAFAQANLAGAPDGDAVAAWEGFRGELRERAESEAEPQLRDIALVFYLGTVAPKPDPASSDVLLAKRALTEISPSNPIWSVSTQALTRAAQALPRDGELEALIEAVVAGQPNVLIGASYLLDRLQSARDPADARAWFSRLNASRYDGTREQLKAQLYDPDHPLRSGKRMPSLVVDDLSSPGSGARRLDIGGLRGKVVLVHFWATWCGPCIAELEQLHALHAALGDRLEIVSISPFDSAADVSKFRKESWPMPWLVGDVPDSEDADFKRRLRVSGVPWYVLIDEDGKIAAASPELTLDTLRDRVAELGTGRLLAVPPSTTAHPPSRGSETPH